MAARATESELDRLSRSIRLHEDEEAVKGVEIKQPREGRLLFKFNHVIDWNHALNGCPWSLDKHVLLLIEIRVDENLTQVDLNWCDFFIHIHELPLSRMNLCAATLIGNQLGIFWDIEMDDTGCSWGSSLRIRVGLDVNAPLKRVLKLRTTIGVEHLARFTYERLPNFCYICGMLGHIAKYCEEQF
ncbi:UNVERIFIED_CONTAM: hypothetical protein Slati_0183600 [Sesamum latifolium]|uniref:CCHC-type domain-containing protein n=1 Tax=Sesamum latifolium TaxID=2727402 RepID=A0AAW2YBW3_9LAMI